VSARTVDLVVRRHTIEAGMRRLAEVAAERGLPARVVEPLRTHHGERLRRLAYRSGNDGDEQRLAELSDELELQLIDAERGRERPLDLASCFSRSAVVVSPPASSWGTSARTALAAPAKTLAAVVPRADRAATADVFFRAALDRLVVVAPLRARP
jgi:hypothetical protein